MYLTPFGISRINIGSNPLQYQQSIMLFIMRRNPRSIEMGENKKASENG